MKTYSEIAINLTSEIKHKIFNLLPYRKSLNYHDCHVRVLGDDHSTIWVNWGPYGCKFEDLPIAAMGTITDTILNCLLEEWIIVSFPYADPENAIRVTRRNNFEKMNFCESFGNYGQEVDCYDAGCYSFGNSSSSIFEDFYQALNEKGFGIGSLMDDNDLTYSDLVEILQYPLNHKNGEAIFSAEFPQMIQFFKEWRKQNEIHTKVTGWTYWDSHNYKTVVSEADFGEVDCNELDKNEQLEILLQMPQTTPHIEGTSINVKTKDFIFHFDRWATNPWYCYVERKQDTSGAFRG